MDKNNYRAETYDISINGNKPPIYFVNVWNTEGTKNPNAYSWNAGRLISASENINRVIEEDPLIKRSDIAKFVVAFPFGFVVYRWGDGSDKLPDFNCEKHGEYEFKDTVGMPSKDPISCPLELKIKGAEADIWCDKNIRTIKDYYSAQREKLSIEFKNPDKPFS